MRQPPRHPTVQESREPLAQTRRAPQAPAAALRQLLDQLPVGVILADAAARPSYANREARNLLAKHDGLATGPAGLTAATAADTRRLRHALTLMETPAHPDGGLPKTQYLALPRPSRRGEPLLLRLSTLQRPLSGTAIFITVPEHLHPMPREAIAVAFGLTPREAALAGLLADGYELRDCARMLVMGEGTARNHLKHVFEKTVKHSQASLVAQLCRIAGPCR